MTHKVTLTFHVDMMSDARWEMAKNAIETILKYVLRLPSYGWALEKLE